MIRISRQHRVVIGCVAAALATAASLSLPAQAATARGDLEAEAAATPDEAAAAPVSKGERRLAKLLEGRVAGEPVRCIRTFPRSRMQTIDKTAYVYGSGTTIYVQRTNAPDSIDDSDALVINRFDPTSLCRVDLATTIDPVTGIFTGAVFFEDFVPYTRVKPAETGGAG
jgi:hypothetical protein